MTDDSAITLDQLPDDPLKMPPPYWRSNGAILHILDALQSLSELLRDLVIIHLRTNENLYDHFEKHPEYDESNDEAALEFAAITEELSSHEHKIRLRTEIVCLMSAIEAEDRINRFCVYNLHRDVAESIEKLSPPEKLLVAATSVTGQSVKGNSVFEAIRKLTTWRNAFAHGHCVDRPTKTLRHNHLIRPDDLPGVPSGILDVMTMINALQLVTNYLNEISINNYGKGGSVEFEEIKDFIEDISSYKFEGNNWVYDITVAKRKQIR